MTVQQEMMVAWILVAVKVGRSGWQPTDLSTGCLQGMKSQGSILKPEQEDYSHHLQNSSAQFSEKEKRWHPGLWLQRENPRCPPSHKAGRQCSRRLSDCEHCSEFDRPSAELRPHNQTRHGTVGLGVKTRS